MVQKKERLRRSHTKEDRNYENQGLESALKTFSGRRFIWSLLAESGVFQNPFNSNALNTAFESGKMLIGQQLLARILEVNSEAYITMMRESKELQMKRTEELAKTEEPTDDYS